MAAKLVCFGLPRDIQEREVERIFDKFGKVDRCFVRDSGSTTMAFVEFVNERDCDDAIRDRDGYEIDGCRLRCERSRPKGEGKRRRDSRPRGRRDSRGRGGYGGRGRRDSRDRGYGKGYGKKGGGGKAAKGGVSNEYHRVVISGVPSGASWQDLKDFLRPAAAPQFADVRGEQGTAGYDNEDDARLVKDKLDGEKMRNRHGDESAVSIKFVPRGEEVDSAPRDRSRSRRRSERRSRSRSRSRSAGY